MFGALNAWITGVRSRAENKTWLMVASAIRSYVVKNEEKVEAQIALVIAQGLVKGIAAMHGANPVVLAAAIDTTWDGFQRLVSLITDLLNSNKDKLRQISAQAKAVYDDSRALLAV